MPDLIPVDHDPFNDPPTNLIPVDHDPWENVPRDPGTNRPLITIPRTAEGVVAKPGQTVQNPDVAGDIAAMPNKAAATVGDMLGVNDAMRAIRGELTPEEAQTFAMGAATMMLGGPEAKAAKVVEEAGPAIAKTAKGIVQDIAEYAGEHGAPDMESGSPLHNVTLNSTYPADFYSGKGLQYYAPGNEGHLDADTYRKIVALKDQPDQLVKIYRAIPWEGKKPGYTLNSGGPAGGVINPGDWVTISQAYAKDHGESALNGQYALVSKKVPARELFTAGDSYHEWGWDPRASQPPQPTLPELKQAGIRAYHGSPYDFNQFDLSKIGTGEGAQAYGHGLYFAENPQTAANYRSNLEQPYQWEDAKGVSELLPSQYRGSLDNARQIIESIRGAMRSGDIKDPAEYLSNYDVGKALEPAYKKAADVVAQKGKMYEVNINADPEHFLDWDKPLSEQHPVVQDALNKIGGPAATMLPDAVTQGRNGKWYTMRGDQVVGRYDGWPDADTANEAMRVMKQNAVPNYTFGEWQKKMNVPFPEEKLAQLGIPGIKYLDQGSRGQTTWTAIHPQGGINDFPNEQQARAFVAKNPEYSLEAPKQTSNYVVFNDKLIDIVKKYGLAGLVAGGASHFSTQPVDHNPFE